MRPAIAMSLRCGPGYIDVSGNFENSWTAENAPVGDQLGVSDQSADAGTAETQQSFRNHTTTGGRKWQSSSLSGSARRIGRGAGRRNGGTWVRDQLLRPAPPIRFRCLTWVIVTTLGFIVECGCAAGSTPSSHTTIQSQRVWSPTQTEQKYLDLLRAQNGQPPSIFVSVPWEDDRTLVTEGYAICADLPYQGWAAGSRQEAEHLNATTEPQYPILQIGWQINVAEDVLCRSQVTGGPSVLPPPPQPAPGNTNAMPPPTVMPPAPGNATSQYVRTESGRVHCMVTTDDQGQGGGPAAVCDASAPGSTGFLQAPIAMSESECKYVPCPGGMHWDLAAVTATGAFRWAQGNIAAGSGIQYSTLNYGQTYDMEGWTIVPTQDGTRFTNDATGHGMFVSIENVYSF
jgi:hypothetical protein